MEVDRLGAALNTVEVAAMPVGLGVVELSTVEHSAQGPVRCIAWGYMQDGPDAGKRFIAASRDPATIQAMHEAGPSASGMPVEVEAAAGGRASFRPRRGTAAGPARL